MSKPVSPKQLAANRANAAQSTGPNTPEGKSRSSQNSVKHGFTASTFTITRIEDLNEIANLQSDLVSTYQPVNSQELFALERMALAQQAILRAARLESGLFTTALNETLDTNDHPFTPMSKELAGAGDLAVTRAQNRNYCLADGFLRLARQSNGWSLFLRYQAQSERLYRRSLEEFTRLKALRPELPNEPISPLQPQPESTTSPNPETNPPPSENVSGAAAGLQSPSRPSAVEAVRPSPPLPAGRHPENSPLRPASTCRRRKTAAPDTRTRRQIPRNTAAFVSRARWQPTASAICSRY
jgi:hypothetical protein